MDLNTAINELKNKEVFDRQMLLVELRRQNESFSPNSLNWILNEMMQEGFIARIGRNKYSVIHKTMKHKIYDYQPSDKLSGIIESLSKEYPLMEFQAWETVQLNAFLNHQIAHNTIFVEVEGMLEESAYETLRDKFGRNVLLKPDKKTFRIYSEDETIIVLKLVSQTPGDKTNTHKILIEKILVDLLANKMVGQIISKSEYPHIFEDVFERYIVDETKLLRYANRRNAEKKVRELIGPR